MTTYDFSTAGIQYPLATSPVDVHGDFKKLAESLDAILPAYGVSYFHVAGEVLYVGTSGGLTNVRPTGGSAAVGICAYANNTNGIVIVEAKGNGTWGSLRDGLS